MSDRPDLEELATTLTSDRDSPRIEPATEIGTGSRGPKRRYLLAERGAV